MVGIFQLELISRDTQKRAVDFRVFNLLFPPAKLRQTKNKTAVVTFIVREILQNVNECDWLNALISN
jgi:hypothetical protein